MVANEATNRPKEVTSRTIALMSFYARYLRKSRAERKDPDALKRHRETLDRASAAAGIEIPAALCFEEIRSGERIEKRPEFKRLLELIEALPRGTQGAVQVMDVDRLSRGTPMERGRIQEALTRAGLQVWTPEGWIDLSQSGQSALYEVKGVFSQLEVAAYKVRVRNTMYGKVLQGQVRRGRVPFGYRYDRNTREPVPDGEAFELLKLICHDALTLSRSRLSARYGVSEAKIQKALMSPVICGYPAECYRLDPDTDRVKRLPREEWIWPSKAGSYPAAISRDEWEELQQVIRARYRRPVKIDAEDAWCRDLVRFNGIDQPVILGSWHNGKRFRYHTYELRPAGRTRVYVDRALVHAEALGAIREALADREWLQQHLTQYLARRGGEKRSSGERGEAVGKNLDRLRRQADALLRKEVAAEADHDAEEVAAIARVRVQVHQEITRARAEMQEIQRQVPVSPQVDRLQAFLSQQADWSPLIRDDLPGAAKAVLANGILERIEVTVEAVEGERTHRRAVTAVRRWARHE